MKNALDWLVSFPSFVNKPVALVNTSPRARHAHDALAEVLRTMSASLIPTASISLPLLGAGLSEDQMVNSREIASRILAAIAALQSALSVGGEPGPNLPIG
jgi:NAD(P)H-dependent FMN reductase